MSITHLDQSGIYVTFINIADQSIIHIQKIPFNTLVQQFERQTVLYLNKRHWQVIATDPADLTQAIQTTKLTLELAEISTPHKHLYSIPTMMRKLPYMDEQSEFNAFTCEIHEDDWRQIEFIQHKDLSEALIELQAITIIWENYRQELQNNTFAFQQLHIRTKIDQPNLNISFKTLQSITQTSSIGALCMSGQEDGQFVEDGFAIKLPMAILYGIAYEDQIKTLCMRPHSKTDLIAQGVTDNASASLTHQQLIQKITQTFNLFYVNWCRCEIYPPTPLLP